jgi:exosortase O
VGNGLKVDWMKKKWLTPEVRARWLSLQDGKLSAAYWFQSPQRTTDDFLARIWDYVSHRQKTWVLVSILFDRLNQPDSPDIQAFTTTIHDVIARELKRT